MCLQTDEHPVLRPPRSIATPRMTTIERCCFLLVLAAALVLRLYRLDSPIMWCDEAESAINALTILEHGYPTSSYLGLPIFENILTEPWPDSDEYEFRDSSYSTDGVAIYHGWLPLYTMAGALKCFGIGPATDGANLVAQCSPADVARRTIAPRIPAVVFGIIFLVLIFRSGVEMYGRDAGWAALIASAFAVPIVHIARQARYYSLTLMLSMACCLLLWRMLRLGRWRDWIGCAIAASLLFHTHVLTFAIVCGAGAVLLPWLIRQRGAWKRLLVCGAIGIAAIVPWGIASGFFTSASTLPRAASTLDLPRDLFMYAIERWPVTLFLAAGTAWIASVQLFGNRLPRRIVEPFVSVRGGCAFLIAWCIIGWLMFMLLIPAASLWLPRAYLGIVGPGILLGAILCAGAARLMQPRHSLVVACLLFAAFMLANAHATYSWNRDGDKAQRNLDLIAQMRIWQLRDGTRVYATPSDQLILTYYTSVPVQSVAAVRRSYFQTCPNDVVIIEAFTRYTPVDPQTVTLAAAKHDLHLAPEQARSWARRILSQQVTEYVRPLVASIDCPAERLPEWTREVLERQRESMAEFANTETNLSCANPAVFRGYTLTDASWWWQIFFYRYIDMQHRTGEQVNYRTRIANARAVVLPSAYVIYHSPGKGSDGSIATARHENEPPSR